MDGVFYCGICGLWWLHTFLSIRYRTRIDAPVPEINMNVTQRDQTGSRTDAETVFVVDSDQSVLNGISSLMATLGVRVRCYRSAEAFLDSRDYENPGCIVTEVHLPGISGLDLQEVLRSRGARHPVIVMTSDADVPIAVRAMLLGALDFIEKPFVDRLLIARVKQGLRLAT